MARHPKCGKTWTGHKPEHCPVCCETFTGTKAGDRHRVGDHNDGTRRCLTEAEMVDVGIVRDHRGFWQIDQRGRAAPNWRRDEPGMGTSALDGETVGQPNLAPLIAAPAARLTPTPRGDSLPTADRPMSGAGHGAP